MRKIHVLGKIRSIIRKYPKVDYWYGCIRKRNDVNVRDFMRELSWNTLSVEIPEVSNMRQIIYYIRSGNTFSGFGAELRRTLDALYFADYYGLTPYIEYTSDYIYSEKNAVNGKTNPFEYYFCQPSSVIKNPNEYRFVRFREEHRELVKNQCMYGSSYELSEEYIQELGEIYKKYVILNSEVEKYVQNSLQSLGVDNQPFIAVHYRGTDFNVGYKNHPNAVSIDDYYNAIDSLLCKLDSSYKIFIATDDSEAMKSFEKRYPGRVVCYMDTFRSENGEPVHFSENGRNQHKYKLGLEILRDIVTLAKGTHLIAGLSQVSYCARIIKASYVEDYLDKIIINKGVKK
jgi:hypothetical protein